MQKRYEWKMYWLKRRGFWEQHGSIKRYNVLKKLNTLKKHFDFKYNYMYGGKKYLFWVHFPNENINYKT